MKKITKLWVRSEEVPEVCADCCLCESVGDDTGFCVVTNEYLEDMVNYGGDQCPLRDIRLHLDQVDLDEENS